MSQSETERNEIEEEARQLEEFIESLPDELKHRLTCRTCGEEFTAPTWQRQGDCPRCELRFYLDPPPLPLRAAPVAARPAARCQHCGKPITRARVGRPRKYCSPRCRSAAFRERWR